MDPHHELGDVPELALEMADTVRTNTSLERTYKCNDKNPANSKTESLKINRRKGVLSFPKRINFSQDDGLGSIVL